MLSAETPLLTLWTLAQFLEAHEFPDVVVVSPLDYARLLRDQRLDDNDAHTVAILGALWKRGPGHGTRKELDWSEKELSYAR